MNKKEIMFCYVLLFYFINEMKQSIMFNDMMKTNDKNN